MLIHIKVGCTALQSRVFIRIVQFDKITIQVTNIFIYWSTNNCAGNQQLDVWDANMRTLDFSIWWLNNQIQLPISWSATSQEHLWIGQL